MAFPAWLLFVEESGGADAEIFAGGDEAEVVGAELRRVVEREVQPAVHRLLGQPHGGRRLREDVCKEDLCLVEETVNGDDTLYQADL